MSNRLKFSTLESLESRRLMSASANIVDGELQIVGTDRKDTIVISLDEQDAAQLNVRVNRDAFTFGLADVQRIRVDGLGGNDKVIVRDKAGAIYVGVVVYGGAGNDSVVTGAGNDTIDGGDGKDTLVSGGGDDFLSGDNGNDKIDGGEDNDVIQAGLGKDNLEGGNGDDNLDGGEGKDKIRTGDGADVVAVDDTNRSEVKDLRDQDGSYLLTRLDEAPQLLMTLHEQIVPGSDVFRIENSGSIYSMYYRFGDDPTVYKTIVEVTEDGNVELVSRELSLDEVREPARNAFAAEHPDVSILAINQYKHGEFDIRFRDADGSIQSVRTDNIIWGLDDADQDTNNDGYSSDGEHGEHDGPQGDDQGQHDGDQEQHDQEQQIPVV